MRENNRLERNSNAELLRIVSMLMILVHHIIVHGLFPGFQYGDMPKGWATSIAMVINGFLYVGASCFVLISGYYGIRFKWKGLLNLYLIVVFYTALWQIGKPIIQGLHLTWEVLTVTLMPFTHRSMWFVTGYFILYCLSPVLNEAVEHLTKQKYLLVLILLTILNVYAGFWWNIYNSNGYNYAQMVYLYMIAGYLREHVGIGFIRQHRWKCFTWYLAGTVLWSAFTIISLNIELQHWKVMAYNNPFTIISSIGFFCFIMSFSFQCSAVNWIAKSCFAMYLLQNKTMLLTFGDFLHKHILSDGACMQRVIAWILIFVFTIAFMAMAVGVDRIRMFFTNPILRMYDKAYEKCSLSKYE